MTLSNMVVRPGRRRLRAGRALAIGTALAAASIGLVVAVSTAIPAHAATTLRSLAEAKGRYFGTALTVGDVNNGSESSVAATQFDMVTPGNEMKWDTTEPSNGSYNFAFGSALCAVRNASARYPVPIAL